MLLKDEVEMLRRITLFSGLPPAKLKLLAFTSDRVMYSRGEDLFHQGDIGDAAYVILSGNADVLVSTPNGQLKVAEVEQNSIVGEIAILCNTPRTATVKTTTPLEALRIRKDDFLKLLADFPEMAVEIMRVLADRLSQTTSELTEARSRAQRAEA
ncbi:cyclic nucleotide-binding domain-containing protein [Sinorhizobium meliloti]|jgi:CRP-like cAMP-binding protein|uniref:Crp/Fnr family transcriptional regulator n=1 Tax=Sinorhizobium kummerowiae TaxID=158892 RepID=A0ABY8T3R3_9HYPH|nr:MULTISPECIES: Crp/Fnr family transcriptional regulator [Sinorhizobium]ASP88480.1 Crp/Fnr family transcriptional regulator [Sinorhizobium meliloti]MDE4616808.1 Crp/Fnr family transcriptional regulator [Sinorhizobium meliloti]MDW9376329.1 cyclic nucleotide-binding domain-containing protein [Sinorhizobium meliloti]MDW9427927.1 cyclic nucleotide-binding domain-containing protein [Sinorhizobium meliloti]MDW9495097.1 cyclic nucleotide-binding domain-containing protein [Sinorhizobium meliloti]